MKLQPKDKKQLLKAALGEIPSDLLIKHVQLVNVITGEIYPANVFVYDGMIAHVESGCGSGQGSDRCGWTGTLSDSRLSGCA